MPSFSNIGTGGMGLEGSFSKQVSDPFNKPTASIQYPNTTTLFQQPNYSQGMNSTTFGGGMNVQGLGLNYGLQSSGNVDNRIPYSGEFTQQQTTTYGGVTYSDSLTINQESYEIGAEGNLDKGLIQDLYQELRDYIRKKKEGKSNWYSEVKESVGGEETPTMAACVLDQRNNIIYFGLSGPWSLMMNSSSDYEEKYSSGSKYKSRVITLAKAMDKKITTFGEARLYLEGELNYKGLSAGDLKMCAEARAIYLMLDNRSSPCDCVVAAMHFEKECPATLCESCVALSETMKLSAYIQRWQKYLTVKKAGGA